MSVNVVPCGYIQTCTHTHRHTQTRTYKHSDVCLCLRDSRELVSIHPPVLLGADYDPEGDAASSVRVDRMDEEEYAALDTGGRGQSSRCASMRAHLVVVVVVCPAASSIHARLCASSL